MLLLLEGGNMILGFLVPWTNEFHFIVFELPVAWVKNLKKTIINLGQADINDAPKNKPIQYDIYQN